MSASLAQDLNTDVLSMIFTDIGVNQRLHMLKITAVCRHWYNVALSTPQAWSRISMNFSVHLEYLKMYLARSGTAPLHACVGEGITDAYWALILQHKGRIRCLTVTACYRVLQTSAFPMLEKLRLYASRNESKNDVLAPHHSTSLLDISRFPRLRYVDMVGVRSTLRDAINRTEGFPRLQRLSITLEKTLHWHRMIMNTAQTLVSLTLMIRLGYGDVVNAHLSLPHLRHFGMYDLFCGDTGAIEITAPQLESVQYLVEGGQPIRLMGDALKVEYLFTNSIKELPQYPKVRTLWIFYASGDFWNNLSGVAAQQAVTSAFASKIGFCPRVEKILVMDPFATYESVDWLLPVVKGTNISVGITRQSRSCIPGFMPKGLAELCECYWNAWIVPD